MKIYWVEQGLCDVPDHDAWLSATEAAHLARLHIPKRRADWRLGRWTAKCAIAACLRGASRELAAIELRPTVLGAPEVFIDGAPAAFTISLTHREGRAGCALTRQYVALGCDLELIEPRSEAFVGDYFTESEQAAIAGLPSGYRFGMIALLWSAKESVLKALKLGLRINTRALQVAPSFVPGRDGWRWLHVNADGLQAFDGWWRPAGQFIQTVVAHPAAAPPLLLHLPAPSPDWVSGVTEKIAAVV